ncbi:hypothetical protein BVZ76_00204 [Haemophilus influenzae]|nr:hypothetical protein BVZ76_00204 [Haemophilus influenzae]PRM44112.1 hypothetical protein BVZ75_00087 [Haemophilus influenzae]
MIFNPFTVLKSPVIFTLLEVTAVTLPEPLALVAFTTVWSPDAAPFNLASFALITKLPLAALMLEPVAVVKVPVVFNVTSVALMFPAMSLLLAVRVVLPLFEVMTDPASVVKVFPVAVKVAAPFFASTFALLPIVKPPVFAVTFTVLPEIVPPIVPVALVTLASPDFASIFEPDLVVKSPLALTLTVLPEIVPLISPVLVVILALPFVALMVEPAVVVTFSDAVIFTVL